MCKKQYAFYKAKTKPLRNSKISRIVNINIISNHHEIPTKRHAERFEIPTVTWKSFRDNLLVHPFLWLFTNKTIKFHESIQHFHIQILQLCQLLVLQETKDIKKYTNEPIKFYKAPCHFVTWQRWWHLKDKEVEEKRWMTSTWWLEISIIGTEMSDSRTVWQLDEPSGFPKWSEDTNILVSTIKVNRK